MTDTTLMTIGDHTLLIGLDNLIVRHPGESTVGCNASAGHHTYFSTIGGVLNELRGSCRVRVTPKEELAYRQKVAYWQATHEGGCHVSGDTGS